MRQHGRAAGRPHHQVIGQQHGERMVAHDVRRAQHGVPQAQRARLAHVAAQHAFGLHGAHQRQQLGLARRFQLAFQLVGGVEVVFNGALAAARDKHHVPHARRPGLFHGVLDQGLVHDGQHFLGAGLGGRQKARAQAGNRENGGLHSRKRHE